MHHVRERARGNAGVRAGDVQRGVVRRVPAGGAAAHPVVDRDLPLARLVHDARRVLAHERGVAVAVRRDERVVAVVAAAADGAHHRVRQRAAVAATVHVRSDQQQPAQGERHEQHQPDPLDSRLTALASHDATLLNTTSLVGGVCDN
jgi:hypothetical protein